MREPVPRLAEPAAPPALRGIDDGTGRPHRQPVPRDDVRGLRRLPLPPDLKEAAVEALVRMLRTELCT